MVLLSYIDTSTVEWIIHWLQNMYYNPFGGDSLTSSHFGCRVVPPIFPLQITLMGFMFLVISTLLSYIYSPRLDSIPPRWVLFAHGLLLFLYQQMIVVCGETFSQPIHRDGNWQVDQISGTFDAVDGKQARRTSSSSPLGELFDHGCDALACAFASLAFGSTIMSGGTTFWFWVITAVPFYLATWEHYFTNTLILPVINGPTEGLMLIYLCHFFTAIVGADWWAQPFGKSLPFLSWVPLINEIPINKVTLFAIIVFAIIPTSLFNVYNVCKVVRARKGSMLLALAMGRKGQGLRRAVLLVGFEVCWLVAKLRKASLDPRALQFLGRLNGGSRSVAVWGRGEEEGGSSIQIVVTEGKRRSQLFFPMSAFGGGGRSFELEEAAVDAIGRWSLSIVERGQGLRRAVLLVGFEVCCLYPFVVLVGGVLIWDYLSPYDLIGNYPHLVIVGTGFAFGFLVGRMILSHLCDEPKGLKTSMCMSLFYLPFAIANALTARLNDGSFSCLLLLMTFVGSLYLHFAVSVIHEITTALGIYCFRVALPVRSGGYCVCRLETSVGCGSDPRSANASNEKKKQGTVSLPDELIFFDILTRLLVRSLLLFRSVSKLWCSLISSPAFVNLNLIQSWADHPDGFALLISVRDRCSSELVLLPASHGGDLAAHFLTLPDSTKHHSMSKNLNGLLCLHHPNRITSQLQNTFHSNNSMHICNPSTREICEIFTLGTDSWRKIYPVFLFNAMVLAWLYGFQQSVCLNNAIHCILCCKGIIVAFDLRDENFRVIPLPRADIASANLKTNLVHGIALSARPYLIQVNGLLAVICSEHEEQNMIEMWVLKDYHSELWIMQSITFLSSWADLVCPLPYGTIYTGGVLLVPHIALHEQC
ncbi:unnamed protein product [Camellia sinensis]